MGGGAYDLPSAAGASSSASPSAVSGKALAPGTEVWDELPEAAQLPRPPEHGRWLAAAAAWADDYDDEYELDELLSIEELGTGPHLPPGDVWAGYERQSALYEGAGYEFHGFQRSFEYEDAEELSDFSDVGEVRCVDDDAEGDRFDYEALSNFENFLRFGGWHAARLLAVPMGISLRGPRRAVVRRIRYQLLAYNGRRMRAFAERLMAEEAAAAASAAPQ